MGKDKLKNTWSTIKTVVKDAKIHIIDKNVLPQVKSINKEVKSRASKAPWYKEATNKDLKLAYKTNAKNIR